jgi:hypothetical protein
MQHIATTYRDFRRSHSAEFDQLKKDVSAALRSRTEISIDDGKREFLTWFESWFLRQVKPLEEVES